jgi:hypothetical protein
MQMYLTVYFGLKNKLVLKMYPFVFHFQQTVPANTIIVFRIDIGSFFCRKDYAIALALGNIAHFALKSFVATWAILLFVNAHSIFLPVKSYTTTY